MDRIARRALAGIVALTLGACTAANPGFGGGAPDGGAAPAGDAAPGEGPDAGEPGPDPPGPTDRDLDGIPDDVDGCPAVADPDQADLDGDGLGDACDPDLDGDDLPNGDDPFPGLANELLVDEPFDDPAAVEQRWSAFGGRWSVDGGELGQRSESDETSVAFLDVASAFALGDVFVEATYRVTGPADPGLGPRFAGPLFRVHDGAAIDMYGCIASVGEPDDRLDAVEFHLFAALDQAGADLPAPLALGATTTVRAFAQGSWLGCALAGARPARAAFVDRSGPMLTGTFGFLTQGASVSIDRIRVFAVPPGTAPPF